MIKSFSSDQKKVFSNFLSLSILQGMNYILPLITLPYLVRVLGAEYFGLLAFATAVIMYFSLITDFGFNISATKEISINRDDKTKLIEIFSSVITIKMLLMIFTFFVLIFLISFLDKFSTHALIYLLTFGIVIGQVFFPVWFFQGVENMKFITYLNILSKLFFTVCIFIFVHTQEDYWIVPLLTSLGYILASVVAMYIVKVKYEIQYQIPSIESLTFCTKESSYFFISNIAGSLYTVSVTVILGLFTNNTIVGYYAAADKIIQAFKGLVTPFMQAVYPYVSRQVNISQTNGLKKIKKIALGTFIVMSGISLGVFLFSEFLVNLILGEGYIESVFILEILSPLPLLVAMGNVFGLQTMIPFGRKKQFSTIIVVSSFISLIISFILVPIYFQIGSAISLILTELIIATTMFIYLQRNGLKLIGTSEQQQKEINL